MTEVIENVNFSWCRLSCDYIMALWHIPRFVNFSSMIDLNIDGHFLMLYLLWLSSLSCHFRGNNWRSRRLNLVLRVFRRLERDLYFHYLNIVLLIITCVCTNEQLLMRMVRCMWPSKNKSEIREMSGMMQLTQFSQASIRTSESARLMHESRGCHRRRVHSFSKSCTPQRSFVLRFHLCSPL